MSKKLRESETSKVSTKARQYFSTQSSHFNHQANKTAGDYGTHAPQVKTRIAMDTHFAGFYKP
jgi:hypothetical protein